MNLKNIIILIFGVFSFMANANNFDKDQIERNIKSYASLADQQAFEYLGTLFYENIEIDYTSLFGGQAQKTTNKDLMKAWSEFLPGFDLTYHDLNIKKLNIDEETASATVKFKAGHWLSNKYWEVSGEYIFKFIKSGSKWYIVSVKMNNPVQKGDITILEDAPKRAKSNLELRKNQLINY